jgi:putative transcriptional regulator
MNVYESILQGLNEAVAYTEGNCKEARVHKISVEPIPHFDASEVKSIRKGLGMTQVVFASVMGVSTKTVEAWEQGINAPNGSSCRLLGLYRADPARAKQLVMES